MNDDNVNKIAAVMCSLFMPPLGVLVRAINKKASGGELLLNLILTVVFWLPGLIHALWISLRD